MSKTKRSLFDFDHHTTVMHSGPTAVVFRAFPSGRLPNPVSAARTNDEDFEPSASTKKETGLVVRGAEVSLLVAGGGEEIVIPDDFLLIQDVDGKVLRVCDLYILGNKGETNSVTKLSPAAHKAVKKWFGDEVSIEKYRVDLPVGGWQRVAKIDGIRYRREGDLEGPYEHPYDPPVDLFRSQTARAWRVVHPDGCIIDERGIVHP